MIPTLFQPHKRILDLSCLPDMNMMFELLVQKNHVILLATLLNDTAATSKILDYVEST